MHVDWERAFVEIRRSLLDDWNKILKTTLLFFKKIN